MRAFFGGVAAFLLVALGPRTADARLASLYSSSVTYCSANTTDSVLVQQLDARYFKDNSSIVFDITASTRVKTLNVTAKIHLNAYGLEPIDLSINLCDLSTALCPLPMYNFSGSATIPIPAVQKKIPGIAYVIPDLEAVATLRLVQIGTNKTVACVQSTLANGWSMRQRAVSWAIGGFTLFTVIVSILLTLWDVLKRPASQPLCSLSARSTLTAFQLRNPYTIISTSPLLYRFFTLFILLQHIVSTALLDLNYPVAYRSFAVNFAWAFGLFSSSLDSQLQRSMNNLRSHTGSHDADQGSKSAIAYGDRSQSPYNGLRVRSLNRRDFITPATVTPFNDAELDPGIPTLTNSIGIATGNAFLSMFYVVLIGIAILIVVAGLGFGIVWLAGRKRSNKTSADWPLDQRYWAGAGAVGIRALLTIFLPVLTLVFFQWTIGDSWLAVLLSVILFLGMSAITAYTALLLIQHRRKGYLLTPASQHPLYALSPYVEQSNPTRWFHTVYVLVPTLIVKSAFIAFAKKSGLTQVVAFIVLSLAEFLAVLVLRPTPTRGADVLEGFLALVRLVTSGCLIAFVQSVGVKPIPRAAVAFVIAVIESVAIIVLFLNFLVDLAKLLVATIRWALLPSDTKAVYNRSAREEASGGMVGTNDREKGDDILRSEEEDEGVGAPLHLPESGRPSSATLTLSGRDNTIMTIKPSSFSASSSPKDKETAFIAATTGAPAPETVESSYYGGAASTLNSPRASTIELSRGGGGAGGLGYLAEGDGDERTVDGRQR